MNPLLLPLAAAQGIRTRRTTEQLPEAAGPTFGTVDGTGGQALRVLVMGESTAAGCGAPNHDSAFAGSFARELAQRSGGSVAWGVVARNGATISQVRRTLLPRIDSTYDVALLLIGVNDVLTQRRAGGWAEDLGAVLDALSERAGRVAMTGIPPLDAFPALPKPLAGFLAQRGRQLDEVAREVCAERVKAEWIDSTRMKLDDADFFARDGFHPSPEGYRLWAELVAAQIAPI